MRESCGRTALNPLLRQNSHLKYFGMSAFEFFVKDEFSIRLTIGKKALTTTIKRTAPTHTKRLQSM